MHRYLSAAKSGWLQAQANNTGLLAAGVTYYAFLSFVPLLAAIFLTYGLLADPSLVAENTRDLAATLPPSAAELVGDQLEEITSDRSGASGLGLLVAIALSIFGARVAAGSIITALNVAFDASESRGLIKANLLALCITIGAMVAFGLIAVLTTLAGTVISDAGGAGASLAIALLAGLGGSILAYRIVPNVDDVSTSEALRGAIPFAIGWVTASAGFAWYASNFGNYNATYGSLGAVVVFLTWLYLSAYLLLLGAHIAAASRSDAH
ncbi:hypothetical protein CD351_01975 [Erythrobacter sp. KY5]|nr:hypothetical protein CD351_01975 [Erythrobacter sp. KY5]